MSTESNPFPIVPSALGVAAIAASQSGALEKLFNDEPSKTDRPAKREVVTGLRFNQSTGSKFHKVDLPPRKRFSGSMEEPDDLEDAFTEIIYTREHIEKNW